VAHTNTNVSNVIKLDSPFAVGLYHPTPSTTGLRFISDDGKLSQTTDGITYSVVNSVGGLPNASYVRRIRSVSSAELPNFIATSGRYDSTIGFSYNGGASWFRVPVDNCTITDLAVVGRQIVMTCYYGPARSITVGGLP
jgi:hypothetical protein